MDDIIGMVGDLETQDLILYAALAIILLLQLRISGRLRRLARLLESQPERPADAKAAPGPARYMREETMAEFQRLHDKGNG